jgi:hypothetical protein
MRNVFGLCSFSDLIISPVTCVRGRAIAQAVSQQFSKAAVRVRAKVRSCGICGGLSDTGVGFLQLLWFPLPILIPPTAPHSSSIIRGWYNRSNSGRRTKWTQSHTPTEKTKRKKSTCVSLAHSFAAVKRMYNVEIS